ncbi:carboxypeptidase regulatory-like domain-containing protein [Acidobacteria bacterium AH-259-G07]|nr:carboxypeptidase regulatory-like domain-containing protein [Acidobacteria bacterium AH-259-G07]
MRDATGAVIPGAEVTVTEVNTGMSRSTVSHDSGFYEILQLAPGTYEVKGELEGFRTFVASGVTLQIREAVRVDIKLELGEITETVIVEGATSTVDTQKAEVGKVVDNKDIIDLPLNGRNALQLALLQPGVIPPEPGAVSGSNFSVNGQRGQNNNFLLEGGNNNDLAANFPTSNANVEALQEFKVQASCYDAEFGRNSGAQINQVIRSGTNEIHGNVYEFHRNNVLDARSFFLSEREKLIQNQFGFTLGGPVIRDKFFLFGSYEGFRRRQEEAITDPFVPSQEVRNGNVAGLLSGLGAAVLDPDGDGMIEVHPIAKTLLDRFVPLPTGAVDASTGLGQLKAAVGEFNDSDQFIIKGNYELRDNNSLAVTYLFDDGEDFDASAFGNPANTVPGFGDFGASRTQNAIINDVHTFAPNLINNFRFAYNRLSLFSVIPENTTAPSELGFDGILPNNAAFQSTPNIRVSGAFSLGGSIQGPQGRGDDTYDLGDTLIWVKGDHSLKFGFNWTHFNQDQIFNFTNSGVHLFAPVLGQDTALVDFLAGFSVFYLQTALPDLHFRQNTLSWFASDSWRLTNRLSMNLGLRYELFFPTFDTQDKIGSVDFIGNGQIGTTQSTRFPNAPPGLLFPGDAGIPRSTTETDKVNLAPRIGLAYDLTGDGRMALRAGYGIYYNVIQTELQLQFLVAQPFGLQATVGPLAGGALPFAGGLFGGLIGGPQHFGAPFDGQTSPFPFTSPANDFFLPIDFTVINNRQNIPYSHQYSLSYQWEFLKDYLLEVAYVGSTGINLLYRNLINFIPFQRNPDNSIDILGDAPPNENFGPNLTTQETGANSVYNSLQASLNKRFGNGLGLLASYTYSHSLDNASALRDFDIQDPLRNDLEKANSNFDITQRFVFSFQYELPFGPGKWLGSGTSGLLGRLIEGWQIGGIFAADDGFPLNFFVSGSNSTTEILAFDDRPTLAGDPMAGISSGKVQGRGVDEDTTYFNTDAFVRCDDTNKGGIGGPCFGNVSRNFLRGPGDVNFDFILLKRTSIPHINEVANLEFRFEAFNLFNNPNFDDPGAGLGGANFGKITSIKILPRIIQFALKLNF